MGLIDWFFKPLNEQKSAQKSADVRAQAMANMRAARERIGDEEIQKMADTLREESMKVKAEKARKEILATDKGTVARHVRSMLDEE